MTQTLHTYRDMRIKYKNHWHKLHLVVLEDCDIEEEQGICPVGDEIDEKIIDDVWKAVYKVIGFIPELEH